MMGTHGPAKLDWFRAKYSPRDPQKPLFGNESALLTPEHGLRRLEPAPAAGITTGHQPQGRYEQSGRYLWVIDEEGVPYIAEIPQPLLENALPKHTNLTGGGRAYLGGELWFATEVVIFLSGGSGRYPPVSPEQLDAAAGVLEAYRYTVTSLGWDSDR
jgi:hypothetical protein